MSASHDHAEGAFVLFFAYVGAVIYFAHQNNVIVAILRGLIWPAYLVYYGLKALGA